MTIFRYSGLPTPGDAPGGPHITLTIHGLTGVGRPQPAPLQGWGKLAPSGGRRPEALSEQLVGRREGSAFALWPTGKGIERR